MPATPKPETGLDFSELDPINIEAAAVGINRQTLHSGIQVNIVGDRLVVTPAAGVGDADGAQTYAVAIQRELRSGERRGDTVFHLVSPGLRDIHIVVFEPFTRIDITHGAARDCHAAAH